MNINDGTPTALKSHAVRPKNMQGEELAMSWMPRPFKSKPRKISFDDFNFTDPNLEQNLEGYARFVFARLAFLKGTLSARFKSRKYHPKGDLTLLHVRQHAERETVVGVSLVQKSTGLTKSACLILPNPKLVDALGQGCRMLSAMAQDGLLGFVELCPDKRVRVWAFFDHPVSIGEANRKMKSLKSRSFISIEGEYYPNEDEKEIYLELPPYPDPDTGAWSMVLTLEESERILDGYSSGKQEPDWDRLLGDVQRDMVLNPQGDGTEDQDKVLFLPASSEASAELGSPTQDAGDVEFLEKGEVAAIPGHNGSATPTDGDDDSDVDDAELESEEEDSSEKAYSMTPLSTSVPGIIGQLLNPDRSVIPTPGEELNEVLNGGWIPRRLYHLSGPSGEGKTTFCSWVSDYAASQKIPVVFVTYQMEKEQLSIYALARAAGVDSSEIERRLHSAARGGSSDELTRDLMVVGRDYFRTGDYLHVLEADSDTTVADVESVVKATRKHFGLLDTNEIFVVIDSVRGLAADGLVATNDADTPSHLARRQNAAVLVTHDLPMSSSTDPTAAPSQAAGHSPEYTAVAEAAEFSFVLESRRIPIPAVTTESTNRKRQQARVVDPLDRLVEESGLDTEVAKKIRVIRKEYPIDEKAAAGYARLVVLKNNGGRTRSPLLFKYLRAHHLFETIPFDPGELLD